MKATIRCRPEDTKLVESVVSDAKKEFEQFLKENTGKEVDITLVLDTKTLEKGECSIGGIVLYCHNNNIIFRNTLDQRLELAFKESSPAIRSGLFTIE